MHPAPFRIPNRYEPMTVEAIRDEVDDAIRERSSQDDDWDLMDVLHDVVDRIDYQVSRGYAVPPTMETARRSLTPRFVHERVGAFIQEVEQGLRRIESRKDGQVVLVYERRPAYA